MCVYIYIYILVCIVVNGSRPRSFLKTSKPVQQIIQSVGWKTQLLCLLGSHINFHHFSPLKWCENLRKSLTIRVLQQVRLCLVGPWDLLTILTYPNAQKW